MPTGIRWTEEERRILGNQVRAGWTLEEVVRDRGLRGGFPPRTIEAVSREMRDLKRGGGSAPRSKVKHNIEKGEVRGSNVSSLDELLDLAGLRKDEWEVLQSTLQYSNNKISQIWARIRPNGKSDILQCQAMVLDEIARAAAGIPVSRYEREEHAWKLLGVLALMDIHLGKLCWMPETGQNYDLKIGIAKFKGAIGDLLQEGAKLGIQRYMVPVGQDFFHVDTLDNTTTGGTRQDVDGRWQKAFDIGYDLWVWAINEILRQAPLDVLFSEGNHDKQRSYFLAKCLEARFHSNPDVRFDLRPVPRKPYRWGTNLLVIAHAQPAKDAKRLLEAITAQCGSDWGETQYHEVLAGDLHHKEVKEDELGALRVRRLSSLAGTDAWHSEMGFVGALRAASLLTYDPEFGPRHEIHHVILPSRTEERATSALLGEK